MGPPCTLQPLRPSPTQHRGPRTRGGMTSVQIAWRTIARLTLGLCRSACLAVGKQMPRAHVPHPPFTDLSAGLSVCTLALLTWVSARACACVSVLVCEAAAVHLLGVPASDSTPRMRQPLWPRISALVVPTMWHMYPELTSPSHPRRSVISCVQSLDSVYISVCAACVMCAMIL